MNFDTLLASIVQTHNSFQSSAVKAVNKSLSMRNWLTGWYIAEFELNGEDRAQYGEQLLAKLSERLKHIKGFSNRNLYLCKQFYTAYPQIRELIPSLIHELPILQSLTAKSDSEDNLQLSTAKSIGERNELELPPIQVIDNLSFTHLVELMKIEDRLKRVFYEIECIKAGWGVKELKRQISSLYFERTGLSKKPKKLRELVQGKSKPATPSDILKNVYSFEFLDLPDSYIVQETNLEKALLDHLEAFILELGHGFCFEARQKRLLIGDEYFFCDLVFYHRILKCHVLIELKIESFSHSNVGQLNTYLNYFKDKVMEEGDNPPVGILLVTNKNEALVEYATAGMDENLFIKKYLVNLPTQEELKAIIQQEIGG